MVERGSMTSLRTTCVLTLQAQEDNLAHFQTQSDVNI